MWTIDPGQQATRRTRGRGPLVVAAIVGGFVLQHILVSMPVEPTPTGIPTPTGVVGASHIGAPASLVAAAIHRVSEVKGTRLLAPLPVRPQASPPSVVDSAANAADAALAASIQRAFSRYSLPYQTTSGLIVAVGRQFRVDPAVPAALFMHEDGNINNRSLFPAHMNWLLYHTRNPGNIKCMYDPCYGGFQVYPTYRAGILDWFRLYDYYTVTLGIHSLTRFIATYCPPNVDGNGAPSAYQSDVIVVAREIRDDTAAG